MLSYYLILYHCTVWVTKKNLIHWDPAVGNYKLRNFVSTSSNAFKNSIFIFTYSSSKIAIFLKVLPFNSFMSLSFRRLRYLSYELINRVKIRLGSVVRRPINTNPGLTFNLRFFIYQFKSIFKKKFPVFFQNIQSSNWSSKRFKLNFLSKLSDLKSYFTLPWGILTQLWTINKF